MPRSYAEEHPVRVRDVLLLALIIGFPLGTGCMSVLINLLRLL